jgi:hypothetical protein
VRDPEDVRADDEEMNDKLRDQLLSRHEAWKEALWPSTEEDDEQEDE